MLATVGRSTRQFGQRSLNLIAFLGAIARSVSNYPATARQMTARIILNQVYFTAVRAIPFLTVIAIVLGVTVIVQIHAQAARYGFADLVGSVLATVIVRELGPLLAAILIIGRSGTAIAAELATNTVHGETEALEAMGVDSLQYFVFPRIVGGTISAALLTVYFNTVALAGGAILATLMGTISLSEYLSSLRLALSTVDLWLPVAKGALFGAGIATLCCYRGLTGGHKTTDIPQSVTRAVVSSLLFVFLASVLVSIVVYL